MPARHDLDQQLSWVAAAPAAVSVLDLIVARPDLGARTVLAEAVLDLELGLAGDNWLARGSRHTADGAAEPGRQLTIMNSRAVAAMAGGVDRWPLAGDQLYTGLDLSEANLPPGSRVAVGAAVVEISALPHLGCAKFRDRFGRDALAWVNSAEGRALRLRGLNAVVVEPGPVRVGDAVRRIA